MKTPLRYILAATLSGSMFLSLGPGCQSVYHTTLREYRKPADELLQRRVDEARASQDAAGRSLATTLEIAQRLSRAEPKRWEGKVRDVRLKLNLVELENWNAHRRLLAISDLLDRREDVATIAAEHTILGTVVIGLRQAQEELDVAAIDLRRVIEELPATYDSDERLRFLDSLTRLQPRLQEAIGRSRLAVKLADEWLQEADLDEYEIAAAK